MTTPTMRNRFTEGHVDADGFRIRYVEAGAGDVVVYLHGAGGLRVSAGHDILAERRRVIAFELPGFGDSPANDRSASMADLANSMIEAVERLGLERFDLMGSSFGGTLAMWLATTRPQLLRTLVLAAPAAIRPDEPEQGGPTTDPSLLYAHPERVPPGPAPTPEVVAKQTALVQRLRGGPRDPELERRLAEMTVPTLVLFGTSDRVIPPEMGRHYRQLLPDCQLVFLYDAGHLLDADRPEAFAAVVEAFQQAPESFLVNQESGLRYP